MDACRAARAAQRDWAATPAPGARERDQADRPPRGGEQGGAGPPRHARDRQALSGVARRGAGDRGHLRLLPLRGPAPLRADRAERDARQAALHVPQRRWGWRPSSRRGTSRWPCPPGTSCPRCSAATRWSGSRPSTRPRSATRSRACSSPAGLPDGSAQPRAVRRAHRLRGTRAGARRGARGQGRVHRLLGGGVADRRAVRPPRPVALPRAGRQEPARGHARRRPRPGGGGRALQRLRHGGPALHLAGHGDRPRVTARRVRGAADPRGRGGADRRPVRGRALRADDPRALPGALPRLARPDPGPPHRLRLERDRADHRRQPARRLRRRPRRRALLPPHDRGRRDRADDDLYAHRDLRTDRSAWPSSATSTRRWTWPTATATGCRRPSTRTTPSGPSASASG